MNSEAYSEPFRLETLGPSKLLHQKRDYIVKFRYSKKTKKIEKITFFDLMTGSGQVTKDALF